jgi:subtilisin family serine protease
MSGTSMATPHVAGVTALWAEKIKASSSLSALQLTARLIGSATTEACRLDWTPSI